MSNSPASFRCPLETCRCGARPITWLWDYMIPRRKVTLLVDDQEMEKSFFALDLAARLTPGERIPPPPLDDGAGSVLILEGDDESHDTLYPRLKGIGARLEKVDMLTVNGPRNREEGRKLPTTIVIHAHTSRLRPGPLAFSVERETIGRLTSTIRGAGRPE